MLHATLLFLVSAIVVAGAWAFPDLVQRPDKITAGAVIVNGGLWVHLLMRKFVP